MVEEESRREDFVSPRDCAKQSRPPSSGREHFPREGSRPASRRDNLDFDRRSRARSPWLGQSCCGAARCPASRGPVSAAFAMRAAPPLTALLARPANRDSLTTPSPRERARARRTEDTLATCCGHCVSGEAVGGRGDHFTESSCGSEMAFRLDVSFPINRPISYD